jgi:putative tryptophan/tyrosine transport system substrate-binding protein
MKRREFIAGLGAAAWPLAARAQQPAMPVIGWLGTSGTMERTLSLPWFAQGLAETGYVVGRNVTMEPGEGDRERLPALAADLVRRHVTVIVVTGANTALVAKAATQTVPVVFMMANDPVEAGVVASFNRPSGNLTGVTVVGTELTGKRLELLRQMVPAADPIAMLGGTADTELMKAETKAMQSAASVLGLRLLVLSAVTESEVAAAFATIVEQHAGALVYSSGALTLAKLDQILSLAGRHAVPT